MNRYVTAILFFIAVLFGLFVLCVEPHLQSSREEDRQGNVLLSIDPDQIRSLHIQSDDDGIQFDRQGSYWEIMTSKMQDRASPEIVAQILQAAQNLKIYDKISAREFKKKLNIKDFGLQWPRERLDFVGAHTSEIWFGNDAAIENRVYARKQDSQTVYVVSDELRNLITLPVNAFRDRQLTQWAPDQIRSFVVKRKGNELELRQIGNRWKILRPLDARANPQKVYQFLDALLGMSIVEFVDDDSGNLSRFGIDEQATSITFYPNTGDPPATLRIGSPVEGEEGGYYAQFTARRSIVHLPASVSKLLEVSAGDLRERSLFHLNPDILDRIVIRSGNDSLVLNRKGEGWIGRTGGQEISIANEKIQKLLSVFEQQEIKKFLAVPENAIASYGLGQPYVSVEFDSVLSENTPEASVGFQKIGSVCFSRPSKDGMLYAQSSDSSEVFVVDASILPLISVDPADWK